MHEPNHSFKTAMRKTHVIASGRIVALIFIFLMLAGQLPAQSLPAVNLKDVNGRVVKSSEIRANQKPMLLVFWSLSDQQSCKNLQGIVEAVGDTIGVEKVKIVTICSNEPGKMPAVIPWIRSEDLEVELYFDTNGALAREMGVKTPFTMLFDKDMKLVCKQAGYCSGSDAVVCEKIRNCLTAGSSGH